MSFFNSGLFWFIQGIFVCLIVMGFKIWTEDREIPMPLWNWVLLGMWVFLFGFTIAFVGTNLGEKEPHAALLGGIVFGLIAIITGIGLWLLLLIGKNPKK